MKKFLVLIFAMIICISVVACGKEEASNEPLDLTGTWVQTNSNSNDAWQEATITDGVIEINWVSDNGDTKSLYWAGSYEAPTEAVDEYTWTSNNDTEKTSNALMASSDQTKTFTYKDGELTYEAGAMGTTMTVKLEKQK